VIKSVSELSPLHQRWLSEVCVRAALGSPPRQRSIQVFRNPFIDRWLGRTHPAVPAMMFSPVIISALLYARGRVGIWGLFGAFLGGLLGLTLLEYLLHRFVLHRAVGPERASRIAAFLHHGYHHIYPSDEGRLVLPPMVTVPFALIIASAYALLLPGGAAAAAFAGTATGYVAYDSMHWWLHHGRARSRVGRWLKRYHLLHHHHQDEGRFGVSTPLWDFVFGTYVRTRMPAARSTTRPRQRAMDGALN
jgi:sterol desaturase/sphingolipid hydroxylase (fatty acid hydroxylase superfamily)